MTNLTVEDNESEGLERAIEVAHTEVENEKIV